MANCFYKGKEVRSRSDRDRDLKLSWAHTVTIIHTDINFRVTESVASIIVEKLLSGFPPGFCSRVRPEGETPGGFGGCPPLARKTRPTGLMLTCYTL